MAPAGSASRAVRVCSPSTNEARAGLGIPSRLFPSPFDAVARHAETRLDERDAADEMARPVEPRLLPLRSPLAATALAQSGGEGTWWHDTVGNFVAEL